MRSREEILEELVLLHGDIKLLEKELSAYPWDVEKPLLIVSFDDLANVLRKSINNEIDFETLVNWANAIECRDDLGFDKEELQEIIFELANPEINGEITKERLERILAAYRQ